MDALALVWLSIGAIGRIVLTGQSTRIYWHPVGTVVHLLAVWFIAWRIVS